MKVLLIIALLSFNTIVFCQSASLEGKRSNLPLNHRWDLNGYVWSQTHRETAKSDKPVLDFEAIDNYERLDNDKIAISPNGKYYVYSTYRGNMFSKEQETLTVQSTSDSWKHSFPSNSPGFFSADSKQYIFKHNNDLCLLQTGSDSMRFVKDVMSYKQSSKIDCEWIAYQLKNIDGTVVVQHLPTTIEKRFDSISSYDFDISSQWLVCKLNSKEKELLIYNLKSGSEKRLRYVDSYVFGTNGDVLVVKIVINQNGESKIELEYLELPDGEINTVWSTTQKNTSIGDYKLDESGKQLVFTVKDESNKLLNNTIWYYKSGMNKAVVKVNNDTIGIMGGLIQSPVSFTENGNYIQFFWQTAPNLPEPKKGAVDVDIWNYKDMVLQSTQLLEKRSIKSYKTIVNIGSGKIIRLENENETLSLLRGDFAIISKSERDRTDRFWDAHRDSMWLISLKDDYRCLLPLISSSSIWFSPEEKYLVYFDAKHGCQYFSYNLSTRKYSKISAGISKEKLGGQDYQGYVFRPAENPEEAAGIVGWLKADKGILVYDNYDIWQLDLTGINKPLNVTNGYGQRNKTLFTLISNSRYSRKNLLFSERDTILLAAFNTQTKYNGFYSQILGNRSNPQLLYMGPHYFQTLEPFGRFITAGMTPIKATGTNTWIVQRETATEAPNYFLTHDFRVFKRLTNFVQQKMYNWITSELHSFKQLDGTMCQGVLYKPENFDSSKKYPVIISFYSEMSSRLYQFPTPEFIAHAAIFSKPAWMTSHGYLVFLPDIDFVKAKWGPSTINTIVGAANYLSNLSYVDSKQLGACGHSNSGRLGYYLLTHSKSFAAMSVSSGTSNLISNAFKMEDNGESNMHWAERGSYPTGLESSLWQQKDNWLDHTSVLHADKVTSPVLIFENKKDASFLQGFEMFTALRRLDKSVWWLQYDKGDHTLDFVFDSSKTIKDFTVRLTQFYDHFLKNAPAPYWMTEGIPASLKGVESRYELDPGGTCALPDKQDCPICKAWNLQYKRTPEMFAKPISEWHLDKEIEAKLEKVQELEHKKNMEKDRLMQKEAVRKLKAKK